MSQPQPLPLLILSQQQSQPVQQSLSQWMDAYSPIRQLRGELTGRNQEQYINIQLADNLKCIVRLSGWSQGKIERKIRQRMRDELAAQQQQKQQQDQQNGQQQQ
ncbi:hypothetical protein GGF37_003008, partial [Kickxella alabastrina]